LPKELVKRADKVAKHEYRSRSELIKEALRRYIKEEDEGKWKTVVDFTKVRKGGVPIDEVISSLKKLNESDRKSTR
jgi:Arc/MetJ-type ribon-helix-helix transcriptional regulator